MKSLEKGILTLIKSALTDKVFALPKDFDALASVKLARAHQISTLVCFGAKHYKIEEAAMDKLLADAYKFTLISEAQTELTEKIKTAFEQEHIDYMLLKGANIKSIYPSPEMRMMSDIDILIKQSQYDKISKIMLSLGFNEKIQSDHELIWQKDKLMVELHKRLIPSYNKDFYAYFGEGWQLAKKQENTCFHKLSAEDEFVFIFTHLAKHYRDAGVGLKHFVDVFLLLENTNLNKEYVLDALKKLKLDEFYINVIKTLNAWFNGGQEDEITTLITKTVFSGGAYGKGENNILSQAVKADKKGFKIKKVLSLMFLPLKKMQKRYACLNKLPILLPVFWVVRWFKILFFKKSDLKSNIKALKNATSDNVQNYRISLNAVGLNYNFKE